MFASTNMTKARTYDDCKLAENDEKILALAPEAIQDGVKTKRDPLEAAAAYRVAFQDPRAARASAVSMATAANLQYGKLGE